MTIFDITRKDWKYKGIFFAECDNKELSKNSGSFFPVLPKDFIIGIMGIIYIDENNIWHSVMRLKFPSGTKQVIRRNYEKKSKENININETYILNDFYKFPMINKKWYKNPTEDIDGMLKIMEDSNMIESKKILSKEELEENDK